MTRRKTPDGAQQLDIFNACYADIPIRDQRDTMERPFFSLAKRPRRTPISYQVNGTQVDVYPVKEFGIATIWDADILIWAATQVTEALNRGAVPGPCIKFHPYSLLKAIRRSPSGENYRRLQDALRRLASTYVETNVGGGQARDGDVPILARISGSDMAAERGAVHLHGTGEHGVARLRRHGLRSLCISTKAVLCCTSRSRESWTADRPLDAFTTRQIAANRSTKDSLREAKIVSEVTLNSR